MNLSAATVAELQHFIVNAKKELNGDLFIPAHHYIHAEVIEVADLIGDSYKLAVDVAKSKAKWIVFAGVRFMAEGAAVLTRPGQTVLSPDPLAGCPMADMIQSSRAETAYQLITALQHRPPVPVVYMNSYVETKAWVGEKKGAVCTSSNAASVIRFFLEKGETLFFFPDQHLGRNVAAAMALPPSQLALITQSFDLVLNDGTRFSKEVLLSGDFPESLRSRLSDIRIFFWDGCCPVHQAFTEAHLKKMRAAYPTAHVVVHPEVHSHLCSQSDSFGSTQHMYNRVLSEPNAAGWVVGTEINFVNRLAKEFPDQTIVPLASFACETMGQITLLQCAKTVEALLLHLRTGAELTQIVSVDPLLKQKAAFALQQMIQIAEG